MHHSFHKNIGRRNGFHHWISTSEMFSEGSCDTEDWNNDADNSGLNTAIKYILTYKTVIFNCNNVSKFVQIFFK